LFTCLATVWWCRDHTVPRFFLCISSYGINKRGSHLLRTLTNYQSCKAGCFDRNILRTTLRLPVERCSCNITKQPDRKVRLATASTAVFPNLVEGTLKPQVSSVHSPEPIVIWKKKMISSKRRCILYEWLIQTSRPVART